jgi:hypothetical protein
LFDPNAIPPPQVPSQPEPGSAAVTPPPPAITGREEPQLPIPAAKPDRPERKWKLIPFAGVEVSSTDNLFFSSTNRRSDFSTMLSPGLAAGWGDYAGEVRQLGTYGQHFKPLEIEADNLPKNFIFGKYNLNAMIFAKNGVQDSVNSDALIAGRWEGGKLTVGARFYFQTITDLDVEVGGRAHRTVYGGEIRTNYTLSGKTSVEINLYNRSQDYSQQLSWQEWSEEDWFTYQIAPKTRVSLGSRLGFVNVESSPTQTFEQLVGRVAFMPGGKVGFNADGGVEWRQFGRGEGSEVFGVFNFSGSYTPFDGTLLTLSAYRRNSPSAVQSNENITATGFSAQLRQRFFQRYYLTIEGGCENANYQSRGALAGTVREDGTTYIRAGVSFDMTKNVSAEVAYQHRGNNSSRADLSFTENMFLVQFKLRL